MTNSHKISHNGSLSQEFKVELDDIIKARDMIKKVAVNTEIATSKNLSQLIGREVFLKLENTQKTGSFKIRGAYNKIANLSNDEKLRGVVACSAGNHAQGVAMSASMLGVKSTIVMPMTASLNKVIATKGYGSHVIQYGEIFDDSYDYARELERNQNLTFVHPFEDPYVVAGQGTLGLEILEKIPDLNSLVIPIGGGGLISGVAVAARALNPKIKIFGVQSAQVPGVFNLFKKENLPIDFSRRTSTIADGIAVKRPSSIIYDRFISKYVHDIVTVDDDEIAEAIVYLLERSKTVVEGSAAAVLAAVLNHQLGLGSKTCLILSGGNIDMNIISKVIEKGQIKRGRLVSLSVIVDDTPGNLSRLTKAIAEQRANVLDVRHDRITEGLFLRETRIDFILETSSHDHVQKIREALNKTGARVV